MISSSKHYSFDLWNTLIKSDPNFKKERALFFYKNFNGLHKELAEVELLIRKVASMCRAINRKTGSNIDAEEMYAMVVYLLNDDKQSLLSINFADLYTEMEQLFIRFMPDTYDKETQQCMEAIKNSGNVTLSILSNTAFIKGRTLRIVLDELNLASFFDFQLYSDELGYSKPNPLVFERLYEAVNALYSPFPVFFEDIIHIGDNPIADIAGAESFGFQAGRVNSNGLSLRQFLPETHFLHPH